jgi:hypothetical protein
MVFPRAWVLLPSQPSGRVSGLVILLLVFNAPVAPALPGRRIKISAQVLAVREVIGVKRVLLPRSRAGPEIGLRSATRTGPRATREWPTL